MYKYTLNFLILCTIFFVSCRSEDELIAVTALIRHGLRLPYSFYPTDPYANVTWPFVLGDLTNAGVREMYDVGIWLRQRYSSFLSEEYNPDQIYVQATDYDRCIMSGNAVLAGLYPPISDEIWNRRVKWQPIPVHITPTWQDIVVNMNTCPKANEIEGVIRGTKISEKIMNENRKFFNYISENSGQLTDFASMYPLFDILFTEAKMHLPLPEWAQRIFPKMLSLIVEYIKMNSPLKIEKQIQIGPILGKIIEQFDRAIEGRDFGNSKTTFRKFMPYFATEWILYDLTYSINLPSIHIPDFGALYSIELRKRSDGTYYVNFLYRKSASLQTEAVPVAIIGKNWNLDYAEFKEYVAPYVVQNPKDWMHLCQDFTGARLTFDPNVTISRK